MKLERGQSSVELALLLPAIVIVLLLAVQVALAQRDRMLVVHGARVAARAAIVEPTESAARAPLRAQGAPLDRARVTITGERSPGALITVRVTMTPTVVPIVGSLIVRSDVSEQLTAQVEGTG